MFGFSKKNTISVAESLQFCLSLAEAAHMAAIVENGAYGEFVVHLPIDGASMVRHLEHEQVRAALIAHIEGRIRADDFHGKLVLPDVDQFGRIRSEKELGKATAVRTVLGLGENPFLTWKR